MKLIRYPGSKHKSANKMFNLMPKDFTEYREPFLGGGAIFGRVWKYFDRVGLPHPTYWLNDIHSLLIKLYRRVRNEDGYSDSLIDLRNSLVPEADHLDEIMERVEWSKIDLYRSGDTTALCFLFWLAFGSMVSTSRPDLCSVSVRGVLARPGLTRVRPWKIIQAKKMLQSVGTLTCVDYREVMLAPGDNVQIYCDPPYLLPVSKYHSEPLYQHHFKSSVQPHLEFLEVLRMCPHRVMCSYGLLPFSKRQLEKMGFRVLLHPLKYSNTRRRKVETNWEYIIMNYNTDGSRRTITQEFERSALLHRLD